MAHREFALRRYFAKVTAKGRIVEKRVIAEPAAAARLVRNAAFDNAVKDAEEPFAFDQRDHADEARRTIADASKFFQQEAVVGFIGRVRPGESRRIHARRAAQRVHFQAGIVCKQQAAGVRAVVARLPNGVFLEGQTVFRAGRNFAKARE